MPGASQEFSCPLLKTSKFQEDAAKDGGDRGKEGLQAFYPNLVPKLDVDRLTKWRFLL